MNHSKLFLASLAEAKQLSTLKEDESSWLKMHNSLSSLMDHLQTPEECNTILEKLKEFMVKTLLSDRSRLSGASINLLNKIISIQKDSFNESIFLNYLFKLVNKPNKVFNQRAEETLMNLNNKLLAKNFIFLKEQYNSVNKNVRRVVIRLLIKVDELLNQEMKMLIEKAKSDNCGEVRKLAKDFSCVSALINSPLKKVVKKEENKINLVKNNQPIEKKIEVKKEVKINELIFDFPKNDLKKEIIDKLAKKVSVKEKVNIYFDKNKMEEDTYNSNLIESINNFLYKSDSTKFSQNDKNLENSVKEISFSQPQIKFDFLKKEEKQTEIKLLTEKKEELQNKTVNFKESLKPNIFLEKEKKNEEFFLEEQKKEIIKEEEKEIIEETQEIKPEVFTKDENSLENFVKEENILKEEIFQTESVIEPEINKEEIILEKVMGEDEIIEVKEEINNNEILNDFSSQKNSNSNSQKETEKTLEIQSNEHLTIINSKEETLISNKLNDNFPEEEKEFYFEKNNLNSQENTLIEEEIFELKEVNQNENNLEIQNKETSLVSDNKSLKKEESLETEKIFSKEIRNISFVSREEEVGELSIILEEKMSVKDKSLIKEEEKNNLVEEENSFIEIANKEEECNLNKIEKFLNNEEIKEHEVKREKKNEELKEIKEELKEIKEEIKEEEIEEQEELKEEIKNKSFCEENEEMAYTSIIKESQESLKNKECVFLEKEETSFLIDKNLNNETLTDKSKLLENDTSLHYDSSVNEKIINSFINNINSNNLTVEEDESMRKKEGTFEE